MAKIKTYDLVIVGGGMAGLSLACFAGRTGLKTLVIDRFKISADIGEDLRTTAISYGSAQILQRAGVWDEMEALGCAIRDIDILDGDSPVLLNFLSDEIEGKSFGWILENRDIRSVLLKYLKPFKSVTLQGGKAITDLQVGDDHNIVSFEDGSRVQASLVVGADGRGSFMRQMMEDIMGVETRGWSYKQRAVICCAYHENPHNNCAVEHFLSGGPFAVLPMRDDDKGRRRSAVVFTEHGPKSKSRMALSDGEFEALLKDHFPQRYGHIELASRRQAYPLSLNHASSYIGPRMALAGDAAHGIHPVAGQGLNLGFRDVDVLSRLIDEVFHAGGDIGAPEMLESYQRKRRFDIMSMIAATDALVRLFSNDSLPLRALRRFGLKAVAKLPPAKRFFMKQAMAERLDQHEAR